MTLKMLLINYLNCDSNPAHHSTMTEHE